MGVRVIPDSVSRPICGNTATLWLVGELHQRSAFPGYSSRIPPGLGPRRVPSGHETRNLSAQLIFWPGIGDLRVMVPWAGWLRFCVLDGDSGIFGI